MQLAFRYIFIFKINTHLTAVIGSYVSYCLKIECGVPRWALRSVFSMAYTPVRSD